MLNAAGGTIASLGRSIVAALLTSLLYRTGGAWFISEPSALFRSRFFGATDCIVAGIIRRCTGGASGRRNRRGRRMQNLDLWYCT